MFLGIHFLERRIFLGPYGRDIEQDLRPPVALFWLMRLEQKNRRRADHRHTWLVPVSLGHDASLLRCMRNQRMVEIVWILERVREDEFWANLAVEGCQLIKNAVRNSHGIVAHIEEYNFR